MISVTIYLRPSRTIEIVNNLKKVLFIYNYEGCHFRVFNSKKSLRDFLNKSSYNCIFETDNEKELDSFIALY
jgi:hypothetical protein